MGIYVKGICNSAREITKHSDITHRESSLYKQFPLSSQLLFSWFHHQFHSSRHRTIKEDTKKYITKPWAVAAPQAWEPAGQGGTWYLWGGTGDQVGWSSWSEGMKRREIQQQRVRKENSWVETRSEKQRWIYQSLSLKFMGAVAVGKRFALAAHGLNDLMGLFQLSLSASTKLLQSLYVIHWNKRHSRNSFPKEKYRVSATFS